MADLKFCARVLMNKMGVFLWISKITSKQKSQFK